MGRLVLAVALAATLAACEPSPPLAGRLVLSVSTEPTDPLLPIDAVRVTVTPASGDGTALSVEASLASEPSLLTPSIALDVTPLVDELGLVALEAQAVGLLEGKVLLRWHGTLAAAEDGLVSVMMAPVGYLCDGDADGFVDCDVDGCCAPGEGTLLDDCDPAFGDSAPGLTEGCDGRDNDCDGDTDEDQGGAACGEGVCAGTEACEAGALVCVVPDAVASDATCDGVDEDCDGDTDDDFAGEACGEGACATVTSCVEGEVVCDGAEPADADTTCDGVDDDCDGDTDEEVEPAPCGEGACAGLSTCADGATGCDGPAPAADDASCDGVDDDCDAETDEDYEPVPCGEGACAVLTACEGGGVTCAEADPAADDASCDGVDDDCDGDTDEDFEPEMCGLGACEALGTCEDGVATCTPGPPSADDATCDGVDDDCDGDHDEDHEPEACVSVTGCPGLFACVDGETVCPVVPGAEDDATCDDHDDDCDGTTDEDWEPTPCGVGACATAAVCDGGDVTCPEVPHPEEDTTCDGVDDDCDDSTDEEYVPGDPCGEGACAGGLVCTDGAEVCDGPPPAAADATCDGVDDDCDGTTDEEVSPGSCVSPDGCATSFVCVDGALVCPALPALMGDATCDGVDDDCDGTTDEQGTCGPAVTLTSPSPGTADATVEVTFETTGGTFEAARVSLDGAAIAETSDQSAPVPVEDIAPGLHELAVELLDAPGGAPLPYPLARDTVVLTVAADPCEDDDDCADALACTIDACLGGTCTWTPTPGCCDHDLQCAPGWTCVDAACVACTDDDDCDDEDACTDDACVQGACRGLLVPACAPPPSPCDDLTCDDHDPDTLDRCDLATGLCAAAPLVPCDGGPVASFDAAELIAQSGAPPVVWHLDGDGLRFADPAIGTYAHPGNVVPAGRLVSPEVTVPATEDGVAWATFRLALATEHDATCGTTSAPALAIDRLTVAALTADAPPEGVSLWSSTSVDDTTLGATVDVRVDLTAWRGATLQLALDFDAGDAHLNDLAGPHVADLVVGLTCDPAPACAGDDACPDADPCAWATCDADLTCQAPAVPACTLDGTELCAP